MENININKKWIKENPEKRKAALKKYNKHQYIIDRRRKASRKRKDEGKELEWQRNNKDKIKSYREKYSNKQHIINKKEWKNCLLYFNYECAYCGITEAQAKEKYKNKLHKEHIDHNGKNDLSNAVPACKDCNSSKWNFEFEKWYNKNNSNYTEKRYNKIVQWIKEDYKFFIK